MARLTRDMAGATPPQLLRTPLRTTSLPAPSLTQRHPWWNVGSAPATSPYASPFATVKFVSVSVQPPPCITSVLF